MARRKKPIPYSSDVRSEDTARALSTLTPKLIPDETRPHAVEFTGNCPRCEDPIQLREWLFAVSGANRLNDDQRKALAARLDEIGIDRSQGDQTFDLTCSCTVQHPKGPEQVNGCGARFRVRVTWP